MKRALQLDLHRLSRIQSDPFARLSDLCHRQLPEDQKAILSSVEHDDPGHATLL